MKASFFQLTSKAKENGSVAAEIRNAGMEIAGHSYTHPQMTKLGAAGWEKEITTATTELGKIHGRKIRFFRLPYGAGVSNSGIRQVIARNGLIHAFWSVDTLDWMAQTPDKIVDRTITMMKKSSRDSGMILFHDIHQRTAIAAPQVMDYLNKENRRVCLLGDIVDQMNSGKEVCPK